jgi:hypothetical protein
MDWAPILQALKTSFSTATGIPETDVLLETEQRGFMGQSKGTRLYFNLDEEDLSIPYASYQDLGSGLEEVVIADRRLGVLCRFAADDHRAPDTGAYAHALANRLRTRIYLSNVASIYQAVGLSLEGADPTTPDPQVDRDNRSMSVASLRLYFFYTVCEGATESPGNENDLTEYFDRVGLEGCPTRAVVGSRVLSDLAQWRYLWAGELTDTARGNLVTLSGDSAVYVESSPFERVWSTGTGAIASESLTLGQLLDGQSIAFVFRSPTPGATISIVGRVSGSRGWALEGLASGAIRLSALGDTETTATLSGALTGSWVVLVISNQSDTLTVYGPDGFDGAIIDGSHLAGETPLTVGTLRQPTEGVQIAILAETFSDDPETLRDDIENELFGT